MQRQIAVSAQLDPLDAFEADGDNTGVVTWSDNKIILQRSLCAVISQVDARIYIAILDSGVVRDVFTPFLGVIADQVVTFARKQVESGYLSGGSPPLTFHPPTSSLPIPAP